MRVGDDGNVGIGTAAPAAKLDVAGNINASGSVTGAQLVSTIGSGTAPISVSSASLVPNLNADLLDGVHASAFAPAGGPYATLGSNISTGNQTINGTGGTDAAGTFSSSNDYATLYVTQSGSGQGLWATAIGNISYGVFASSPYIGVVGSGTDEYGGTGVFGTGVYGVSGYGTQIGVAASGGAYGMEGLAQSLSGLAGVYGGGGYAGVWGVGDFIGVYGQPAIAGAYGVYADGDLGASGAKSAVVALPDNRVVSLYAMESPDIWFEDFGSGQLSNGVAEVTLDPTFALTVNTEMSYHVFLTPNGDCEGLYVASKIPTGFEVRELRGGKSNIGFDYRIVAHRRGYESLRLQEVEADAETVAALRKHAQAAPGRPKLKVPKKPEVPKAPPVLPKVQAPPSAPALVRPLVPGTLPVPSGLVGAPKTTLAPLANQGNLVK